MIYRAKFNLTDEIVSADDAEEYMNFDANLQDYIEKEDIRAKVYKIEFIFNRQNYKSGHIDVYVNEKLNDAQLKYLSNFLKSQVFEGYGKDFSTEEFANYDAALYDGYWSFCPERAWEDDYEEERVISRFCPSDEYTLELVKD